MGFLLASNVAASVLPGAQPNTRNRLLKNQNKLLRNKVKIMEHRTPSAIYIKIPVRTSCHSKSITTKTTFKFIEDRIIFI